MDNKLIKLNRAVKVPLYPTPEQERLILQTFGCCRFVWNQILADEQEFFAATGKHFIVTPAKYKGVFPFLKDVDSLALCNEQLAIKKAFAAFFSKENKTKYPNFKSKKHGRDSYTTCIASEGATNLAVGAGYVKLPKIGCVMANIYRKIPKNWVLKSATLSRTKSGKFFCSLLFEFLIETPEPAALPTEDNTIGLDYSSPHFYVDDNGCVPAKERWFRATEAKLAKEQRKLSRMQRGSKNYEQQLHKVELIHEKVANQRKDFIHKESRRIANAYDAVCLEDLNLADLSRSLTLGKSTADNGFGMFRQCLKYKLEEQGKYYIVVDKWFPSSKTCHYCGSKNKGLALKERAWVCPVCGRSIERDANAAINIKWEGLRQFYNQSA